jgi:hypothetical protein
MRVECRWGLNAALQGNVPSTAHVSRAEQPAKNTLRIRLRGRISVQLGSIAPHLSLIAGDIHCRKARRQSGCVMGKQFLRKGFSGKFPR